MCLLKHAFFFLDGHMVQSVATVAVIRICTFVAGPCSVVGNVSGYRCVSDCRSRGCKFDPGPVPYFHGD